MEGGRLQRFASIEVHPALPEHVGRGADLPPLLAVEHGPVRVRVLGPALELADLGAGALSRLSSLFLSLFRLRTSITLLEFVIK